MLRFGLSLLVAHELVVLVAATNSSDAWTEPAGYALTSCSDCMLAIVAGSGIVLCFVPLVYLQMKAAPSKPWYGQHRNNKLAPAELSLPPPASPTQAPTAPATPTVVVTAMPAAPQPTFTTVRTSGGELISQRPLPERPAPALGPRAEGGGIALLGPPTTSSRRLPPLPPLARNCTTSWPSSMSDRVARLSMQPPAGSAGSVGSVDARYLGQWGSTPAANPPQDYGAGVGPPRAPM